MLADEVGIEEPLLQLKLAFEAEQEWELLLSEVSTADALSRFLVFAASRAPAYRSILERRGGTAYLELKEFPVARRADHARESSRFITRDVATLDPRLVVSTNGTMGTPLRVQFDRPGWYELNYGTYAAVASAVPGLRERLSPGVEGVFFINNALYQQRVSMHLPTLGLAVLRQLILERSHSEDRACVEYLRTRSVPLLYGKPSTLLRLATLDAELGGGRIQPFAVLTSGEALYEDQRRKLEGWFETPLLDAYVATEGGLIALECVRHAGLHVRTSLLRVEVELPDGTIQDTGRGRILITNLSNRAQTFIRYALGDDVELIRSTCDCGFEGPTLRRLFGRECASFRFPVGEISTARLGAFLTELPLREFQLRQQEPGPALLKWVPERFDPELVGELARAIEAWLVRQGLSECIASVPLTRITPRGGKQRRFIRLPATERP